MIIGSGFSGLWAQSCPFPPPPPFGATVSVGTLNIPNPGDSVCFPGNVNFLVPGDNIIIGGLVPGTVYTVSTCGTSGGQTSSINSYLGVWESGGTTFLGESLGGTCGTGDDERLTFTATQTSHVVTFRVEGGCGGNFGAPSDICILNANPAAPSCTPGTITVNPTDQTVCPSATANFSADTTGGGAADSLRWEVSTNGGSTWTILGNTGSYSGTTTLSLVVNPAFSVFNGYQYRMVAYYCSTPNAVFSAAATLTSVDNQGPVITVCPLDQPVYVDNSCVAQLDNYTSQVLATDNCDPSPAIGQSPAPGTNAGLVGNMLTVTMIATDINSNATTCTFNVTVQDSTPPTAVCQNATVQLNAGGSATVAASAVDGGSSDNCGLGTLSVSPSNFTCANLGGNTVTLTVPDINGNSASCTATVTVEDNLAPTINCPPDQAVYLDGNCEIVLPDFTSSAVVSDNCPGSTTVSQTPAPGTNLGFLTTSVAVTLRATDASSNFDECNFDIFKFDTTTPTAVCQNATVYLNAGGSASITASDVDGGSTDNCDSSPGLSAAPTSFNCTSLGTNAVTLTVTDDSSNVSTCTANVTVLDSTSPTAVCQNITVQLDAVGQVNITASDVDGGSTDNCGVASLAASPNSFNCSNIGNNNVTLTVTDGSSNSSTCTATVTVQDTISPTAVCQNTTVQLDASGNATVTASDVDGGSSDNCSLSSLSVSPSSFTCANVGANTVTLTVQDNSGSIATCTATVTVQDTISPMAVCQNITVQLDGSGNASITAADVDGGSTDNCGIAGLSATPTAFTCTNAGANNVTLTVTDINGNSGTCIAIVTVQDTISPMAVCQNITVQLDGSGNASITAADVDGGSTDNCGIAGLSATPNAFTCTNVGANNVTLTVTDVNGNSDVCTAVVTVEDTISPMAVCQNITVQLDG
ncbi:MAG: HYR domain-containing protein, partial [Bacteroidota bacterium]